MQNFYPGKKVILPASAFFHSHGRVRFYTNARRLLCFIFGPLEIIAKSNESLYLP